MNKKTNAKKKKGKSKLKIVTKAIRKKDEREDLKGYVCKCCKPFYDALGLTDSQKKELIQHASRHRSKHTPPSTPPGFWDLSFMNSNDNKSNR